RRPCALAPTPMSKGRPPEHLLALEPLPAITRLAVPTTVVMLVAAVSNVLYTYYVSRLGADAIAAVSLVFPISLVAMTAMGGGIEAAMARAVGARRRERANATAGSAFLLAIAIGVLFAVVMQIAGRTIFAWMGGRGTVLDDATGFARVLFGGAAITFLAGMLD